MKHLRKLFWPTALFAALALALPAQADPPPWAPAHGYRAKQHRYVYYPEHQVYYEPARNAWFWLDDGRWRFGASLPVGMMSISGPGVSLFMTTARPYEQHVHVVETYRVRPYPVYWYDDGYRHHHHKHRHGGRHRHDD